MAKAGAGKRKMTAVHKKRYGVSKKSSKKGCYVATCVYGSYDCPEVWTLRRYRDYSLENHWYGRLFIRIYYAVSPVMVKVFGKTTLFTAIMRPVLDRKVLGLKKQGYSDFPYQD